MIGASFGRTGTLSLKAALEEPGFGPPSPHEGRHSTPRLRADVVILTVRDPDRWYESASATIYDIGKSGASPCFRMQSPPSSRPPQSRR